MLYSRQRYGESVQVTQEILSAHGVQPGMALVVCFPFDPWAIGGVFRDAALACGARVLPLGLSTGEPSMGAMLASFDPDVFCGSASLLVRWHAELKQPQTGQPTRQRLVFHAGESLRPLVRQACATAWNAKVINVYGMAEFDSVGSEGPREPGLILSPHLHYALTLPGQGEYQSLSEGEEGELLIRTQEMPEWYHTRDLVRVLGRVSADEVLWPGSWRIQHLSRTDNAMKLPDGSLVSAEQLEEVARELPGIEYLQLQLVRSPDSSASLRLLATPCQGVAPPSITELQDTLLHGCLELADAVMHRAVLLEVRLVDASQLERTQRGKVRSFVEVDL